MSGKEVITYLEHSLMDVACVSTDKAEITTKVAFAWWLNAKDVVSLY